MSPQGSKTPRTTGRRGRQLGHPRVDHHLADRLQRDGIGVAAHGNQQRELSRNDAGRGRIGHLRPLSPRVA